MLLIVDNFVLFYSSYIGGYIAIRELYFLVGLLTILVAGNVLITFLQLPSMFLPVYHNQRSLQSGIFGPEFGETLDKIDSFLIILQGKILSFLDYIQIKYQS